MHMASKVYLNKQQTVQIKANLMHACKPPACCLKCTRDFSAGKRKMPVTNSIRHGHTLHGHPSQALSYARITSRYVHTKETIGSSYICMVLGIDHLQYLLRDEKNRHWDISIKLIVLTF